MSGSMKRSNGVRRRLSHRERAEEVSNGVRTGREFVCILANMWAGGGRHCCWQCSLGGRCRRVRRCRIFSLGNTLRTLVSACVTYNEVLLLPLYQLEVRFVLEWKYSSHSCKRFCYVRNPLHVSYLGLSNPQQPPLIRFRQFPGQRDMHIEQKRPTSDLEIAEIQLAAGAGD